jgi:hypothetical protein
MGSWLAAQEGLGGPCAGFAVRRTSRRDIEALGMPMRVQDAKPKAIRRSPDHQDEMYTVALRNPRSPRPFAEHQGLTGDDADELVRVYLALGHAPDRIVVICQRAAAA